MCARILCSIAAMTLSAMLGCATTSTAATQDDTWRVVSAIPDLGVPVGPNACNPAQPSELVLLKVRMDEQKAKILRRDSAGHPEIVVIRERFGSIIFVRGLHRCVDEAARITEGSSFEFWRPRRSRGGGTGNPVATQPNQQGAHHEGGMPEGTDEADHSLSASQQGTIGAYIRRCWIYASGALHKTPMQVMLIVTTDADGVARAVKFAPADQARMDQDPVFQAFADRARRAVLDPRCANLPLPRHLLGEVNVLSFRFSP